MINTKVAVLTGQNKRCGVHVYAQRLCQSLELSGVKADLVLLPENLESRLSFRAISQLAKQLEKYDLG
jgi:hypothetical protein